MRYLNFGLMRLKYVLFMALLVFIFLPAFAFSSVTDFDIGLSKLIAKKLQPYSSKYSIKQFYIGRGYQAVWTTQGSVSETAKELFYLIEEDQILPADAKIKTEGRQLKENARSLYRSKAPLNKIATLELKLSRLYNKYADFRLYGSIDWEKFKKKLHGLRSKKIFAGWDRYKPQTDPFTLLQNALNGSTLKEVFVDAEPKSYHYAALKKQLLKYLKMRQAQAWDRIAYTGVIRADMFDVRIPAIRERLLQLGIPIACEGEPEHYDSCLQEAILVFQQRHGLEADGIIGRNTMHALNLSIDQRIEMIQLNLDRIKWLVPRNEMRHIFINIPAFTLYIEEEGTLLHQMKVIIGKPKNPTPVFSDTVESLVINPSWIVPKSIIQKELIPKLLKDPRAMDKEGIDIYAGWGKEAQKIGGGVVNWQAFRYTKKLPFRFIQPPGDDNALGKVKFLFPNRFSVYMHDTPAKSLFGRDVRAFSHGCIRLERPIEMLRFFAQIDENVDYEEAQIRLEGNNGKHIMLATHVPVDVIYLTAWVDYNGVLQFRNDLYGYDRMQRASLKKW